MKTLSLYVAPIILSFGLSSLTPVAAETISCGKLVGAFNANEMRALRDHKNKTYIVSGRVESVGADFMYNPQINLSDGSEWSFNSCIAEPARGEDFYYDLDEGQFVKMQCKVTGEMMGSPMLEGCVLAN